MEGTHAADESLRCLSVAHAAVEAEKLQQRHVPNDKAAKLVPQIESRFRTRIRFEDAAIVTAEADVDALQTLVKGANGVLELDEIIKVPQIQLETILAPENSHSILKDRLRNSKNVDRNCRMVANLQIACSVPIPILVGISDVSQTRLAVTFLPVLFVCHVNGARPDKVSIDIDLQPHFVREIQEARAIGFDI
jgi:hypothetical protein